MNTTFYYSPAKCGSGKTTWAMDQMGCQPGRYVYAVDRVEEFESRKAKIIEMANSTHPACQPVIVMLSSQGGDVVTWDFPKRVADYSQTPHVVIIITHEALKIVSHREIEDGGWTLIIDEDPKLWSSFPITVGVSKPYWEANYNLEADTDGCSRVTLKSDAASMSAVSLDDLTRPIAALHDRIRKRKVMVNLDASEGWSSLAATSQLTFYMVWDVTELAVYDRVIFLANAFDHLISFRLITALFPIKMVALDTGTQGVWQPRSMTINFVADDHVAGSYFFQSTDQGKEAVKTWSSWVRDRTSEADHYWTANKFQQNLYLPGKWISPKIAGSNLYRDRTQCSVLYSAKASKTENEIFASLAGGLIDADAVRRDREFEDLIQIVFRSSLRMPEDTRPVMVNVYDREQAEFLRDYFISAGFPFSIKLVHHDLGITYDKKKPGRKPNPTKTPLTSAERQRAKRERDRARLLNASPKAA